MSNNIKLDRLVNETKFVLFTCDLHYKAFRTVIVAVLLNATVIATVIQFHPSLIFAGKAGVYQSGASYGTPF